MDNESRRTPIKIELITLQGVANYGSVLQALATQAFFEKHGADVNVINYVKAPNRWENLLQTWSHGNPIKAAVMLPTVRRWKHVFQGFNDSNLHLTGEVLTTQEDFADYKLDADAYCTGSDQVWNSVWNKGILPPLYLSFVPPEKYKFAFSASFGQPELATEEVSQTKQYIEQYRHISVREDEGRKILQEQYGYENAIQTVDPTLCMDADFWRRHAQPVPLKSKGYILIYHLNRSREFDDYAVKLAGKTGLELVRFCTRYDQIYRPGKSMLVPEVGEFIWLLANARYVLTDSFHATAFSMNMGVMPLCVYPPEFSGRLASFLRLVESEQCHIRDFDDFDVIERTPDFSQIDSILADERKKAGDYISMVFDEIAAEKQSHI